VALRPDLQPQVAVLVREIQSHIANSRTMVYSTHLAREIQKERTKDFPCAIMTIYLRTRAAPLGEQLLSAPVPASPQPLHLPAVRHEVSKAPCQLCGSKLGMGFPWVIPIVCHQRTIGAGCTKGVGGPIQSGTGVTLVLLPLGSMGMELHRSVWCLAPWHSGVHGVGHALTAPL
jgi:hypothetical protein